MNEVITRTASTMQLDSSKTDDDENDDKKDEDHDSPMAAEVIGVTVLYVYDGDDNKGV